MAHAVTKPESQRPIWAEISLGAIARNLRAIQKHVGAQRKVLCIVKANAYGHGAVPVARALEAAGAACFGVTCVAEGIELREAGIRRPILVLSGFWPGEEILLFAHRLTPAIYSLEQWRHLERAFANFTHENLPLGVHLKVDTGMNRLGIAPEEVKEFLSLLAGARNVKLEGTFTHFASSEDFDNGQTEEQQQRFAGVLSEFHAAGADPGIVHMANSAAIAMRPGTWMHMVRPGALIYGYHQFYSPEERETDARQRLPLEPAFSLRARVLSVRELPAGARVGYNGRFITQRPSRIAVVAGGYADGIVRRLSNQGKMIARGRCVPIVGTVSMDLTAVDVTDAPQVQVGDVVTVFGRSPEAACPPVFANDVARLLGTVTSDLLCSVGARVPRNYTA